MTPAAIAFSSIFNNILFHELKPFPLPSKQSSLQSKIPPTNFVTNIFRGEDLLVLTICQMRTVAVKNRSKLLCWRSFTEERKQREHPVGVFDLSELLAHSIVLSN